MSEIKDGGPAFPATGVYEDETKGMSLRDYFAAAALPSLVQEALKLDHDSWDATAGHAYIIADAMLKERNKPCA